MKVAISCLLITLVILAVYANALDAGFIWDDRNLIEENVYLKKWFNLPNFFSKEIWKSFEAKYYFYRPLLMISFLADYSLWGLDAQGYHLVNVILHILASLALFWLISILYKDWLLALFTGLLFGLHPVHTEAVTYISGRGNSMALLFMLLCFIFYIKYQEKKDLWACIAVPAAFVFALLSSEISLILPALLLLYHYNFRKRIKVAEFSSLAAIALLYIGARIVFFRELLPHVSSSSALLQRLPGFFVAISTYIKLLFLPFSLHMGYAKALFDFSDPLAIRGMCIVFASVLLLLVFKKKRSSSVLSFALGWFFLSLLPVSNLYPINAYMAEHWLYLPSIGFFLILGKGLSSLYRVKYGKMPAVIMLALLLIFYSVLIAKQNRFWSEPIAFYKQALKYIKDDPRIYNELGRAYAARREYSEAVPMFRQAARINSQYYRAYYNLGNVYQDLGQYQKALAEYTRSLQTNPYFARTHNNLGATYYAMGKNEEAVLAFNRALGLDPDFAAGYYNLGNAYRAQGKNKEAISAFLKAIDIEPGFAQAHYNLGNAYQQLGQSESAIEYYKSAISYDPSNYRAYNNLAIMYFRQKQYDLAIKYADQAQALGFENPALLDALESHRK
ncbi:MAG: tetratricopeptide repeat protein [Candidatus Omnitrophica bacterium]|nr:tetratricopeptide repeat protein [Candidatus Omnitrophota bacterium]